jgi:hypothetical protein
MKGGWEKGNAPQGDCGARGKDRLLGALCFPSLEHGNGLLASQLAMGLAESWPHDAKGCAVFRGED